MANKKVKNATECTYNGITFKSKLELYCYKYFLDNGFEMPYEPVNYKLYPGFTSHTNVYLPVKQKNSKVYKLTLKSQKLRPITYTPDFIFEFKDHTVFIETKGKANDAYPIRRKLFLNLLEQILKDNPEKTFWFFEPHNQEQVRKTFEIITEQILSNE